MRYPGVTKRKDGTYQKKVKKASGGYKYLYGHTEKEAYDKALLYSEDSDSGPMFEKFAEEWYLEVADSWKPGTRRSYKPRYKEIKEYFAGQRLKKIDAADIKNYFEWMKSQGYGEKTAKNSRSVLNQIFLHSITCEDRWRTINPVTDVRLPKNMHKSKRNPPTDEQMEKVRKGLNSGEGLLAAFVMYANTRTGEALGVQYKHIEGGRIKIEQEVIFDSSNSPTLVNYLKTGNAERYIGIMAALKQYLPPEKELKRHPEYFLFGRKEPWTRSKLSKTWLRWCRSVDLAHQEERVDKNGKIVVEWKPDIDRHQLRHDFASRCFEADIDEGVAAAMFGHATADQMRQLYQYIRNRQLDEAVKKLDELESKFV